MSISVWNDLNEPSSINDASSANRDFLNSIFVKKMPLMSSVIEILCESSSIHIIMLAASLDKRIQTDMMHLITYSINIYWRRLTTTEFEVLHISGLHRSWISNTPQVPVEGQLSEKVPVVSGVHRSSSISDHLTTLTLKAPTKNASEEASAEVVCCK